MWDHPTFGTSHRVNVLTASAALDNATLAALNAQHYLTSASGPLAVYGPAYYGWEKLPEPYRSALSAASRAALASFPPDWPELEWLVISAYNGNNSNKATADPRDGHNYATLNNALIAPLSRGSVTRKFLPPDYVLIRGSNCYALLCKSFEHPLPNACS